ncbi:hypothetical protein BGZ54_005672 [Gamsiella multidivaricata]|nr:hypothetical protein BGZ54_005672 [Gamsiella multidivaricata]
MSTSIIPQSAWALLQEVFAHRCSRCKMDQSPQEVRRIRKISHLDDSHEPSPKRRLLEDDVVTVGGDSRQGPSIEHNGTTSRERNMDDWILARQWHEPLGAVSLQLPCGHPFVPDSLPKLSVIYQEGAIMAMLKGDILAMRQDDQEDLSWGDHGIRNGFRSRTLFAALHALKYTKQIEIDATVSWIESSSTLQINFSIFLHISLLSKSLSCKGAFNSGMQDLIRFLFPPSLDSRHFTNNAIKDLYTHLKPAATTEPPSGIQPASLLPQLLLFQRRSVAWCLKRECGIVNVSGEVEYEEPALIDKLPLSWEQISTPGEVDLFINRPCGLLCLADPDLLISEPEPRGGILAEEMGLGKTVEMLALIVLNRRKLDLPQVSVGASETQVLEQQLSEAHLDDPTRAETAANRRSGNNSKSSTAETPLIKSAATLIITPLSIMHQWAGEIENHAPSLRVFIYEESAHERITAEELAQYDIVLTTYPVLSKEVNYTTHYDRPRRYERLYVPRRSPFVQIDWWRVCLDEAQMIEGVTVSQAAAMTLLIPRVMSWAISGTPIRRNVEDLHSLLAFLNQEPIASNKRLWKLLTSFSFRSTFVSSYQRIMHRYAKRDVVQELALPPQLRLTYGIHFTEIERANYTEKWEQCLAECDVNIANDNSEEAEKLQSWFMRLRQTCCHPQIGSRNKEALGRTNLRTIDEVLDAMVQQNNTQLFTKERTQFGIKLKRAVLNSRIHKDASELRLFLILENEAAQQVSKWDAKFQEQRGKRAEERELRRADAIDKGKGVAQETSRQEEDGMADDIDILGKSKLNADDAYEQAMLRHRDWLEQHHRIVFFTAGFHHDLGMEPEETEYYKRAEDIRQQILGLAEQKFNKVLSFVQEVVQRVALDGKYIIPASKFAGGIELRRHLEQLEFVRSLLNEQLEIVAQWRRDLVEKLTQPLMQDGEDGEQYQYSIDLQHTLESYLHFYGRMLLLRKDIISGSDEAIANHVASVEKQKEHADMVRRRENRIRTFKRKAGEEEISKKEEDLDTRLEREMNDLIKPELASSMRSIRAAMKPLANDAAGPNPERQMAELEDLRLKDEQSRQTKVVLELEREISYFRTLTAARTVYYRQLQVISDTVRDIESNDPEEDIGDCLQEENKLQLEITRLIAKQRYLEHLAEDSGQGSQTDEEKICLICRTPYELGLMTECGHVFCEHCLLEWTKIHSKCPSCNSVISRRRLTRVTMTGLGVTTSEAEPNAASAEPGPSSSSPSTAVKEPQHGANLRLVPEVIRRVTVQDGYGSKIDSIVRHIAFLVREDPNTKCLVFSQWANLLKLLGNSLRDNQIGFVKLDGASVKAAVKQFKESRDKHVFMLHAKSQSAQAAAAGATNDHDSNDDKQGSGTSTLTSMSHDATSEKSAAGFDADIAMTASEVARAQNRNGELVKLEDLKYCFRVQKQMNLTAAMQ